MRLGLSSTMAALLAGTGLALGQAPVALAPEQSVEIIPDRAPPRGLLQRVSAMTAAQAQPAPLPAPAAGPSTYAPNAPSYAPADLSEAPTALDSGGGSTSAYPEQQNRFWAGTDFLLWRFGSIPLPHFQSLVAGGTVTVFGKNITLDQNGNFVSEQIFSQAFPTNIAVNTGLPGGQDQDLRDQPGIRFNIGYWFDDDQTFGFDASYFWLWNRNVGFSQSTQIFGQTVDTGLQQTITFIAGQNLTAPPPISSPLFVAANTSTSLFGSVSNQIWGVEANGRSRIMYFGPVTVDILAGLRYIEVKQESTIAQNVTLSPSGPAQVDQGLGQPFTSTATLTGTFQQNFIDSIKLKNHFYGGQVGAFVEWYVTPRLFLSGTGKAAIGGMRQTAELFGSTTGNTTSIGGLLVSPTDSGQEVSVDRIAFVPEATLKLGLQLSPAIRVFAGYNVIHFSTIAKVGNAVAQTTTTTSLTFGNLPTQSSQFVQPGFRFTGEKTNLQGIDLGAEFRW